LLQVAKVSHEDPILFITEEKFFSSAARESAGIEFAPGFPD
jgi:hypothetical protein